MPRLEGRLARSYRRIVNIIAVETLSFLAVELAEFAAENRSAHPRHESPVERQVVHTDELRCHGLLRLNEVADVGAAEARAGRARAERVKRRLLQAVDATPKVELAARGEAHPLRR